MKKEIALGALALITMTTSSISIANSPSDPLLNMADITISAHGIAQLNGTEFTKLDLTQAATSKGPSPFLDWKCHTNNCKPN